MRDFTIEIYQKLINSLLSKNNAFYTFNDYLYFPEKPSIILRHDAERLPENSLLFAQIQSGLGIKGSYYFRAVPQSFNSEIIKKIASLGHEIGYHYETMDTCKGNIDEAYNEFCRNLKKFRKLVPISTICMHGSPLSKYDNRDIWEKYDYKELGLIGEPYFDIDFNEVLYLTDTGRRWDGERFSVRDKIAGSRKSEVGSHQSAVGSRQQYFHSTADIIRAAEENTLPQKIMFTFHPQRWTDKSLPWLKELLWQNFKNQVKRALVRGEK